MSTARYDVRESARARPLFHDGLFRFSHSDEVRGYIVAIQVFLDESGKIGDSKHIVCAAVAAKPAAWETLADKWCRRLPRGIRSISMKEAVGFRGQFKDWKTRAKERDELLNDLARFAHNDVEIATASCISAADFRATSPAQRGRLKDDPLYAEVEGCIKLVMARTHPGELLQVCFDSSEEYAVQCIRIYHKLRFTNEEFKQRCGNIAFGEDEYFIGLQLADMYAYCVRAQLDADGQPVPLVDDLMATMAPSGFHEDEYGYPAGYGLGHGKLTMRTRKGEPTEVQGRR